MSPFASTTALDVAYDLAGSGPPLVLLHAGVTDRHLWDSMVPALADRFTVYVPDLRGFGETRVTAPGPWTLHGDLAGFLEAVEIERAHLCGVSMGGAAALHTALETPDLVERIVLINPALYGFRISDNTTLATWEKIDDAIESGDHEAAATLEADMWLAGPSRSLGDMDPEIVAAMRRMLMASYLLDKGGEERPPDPMPADRLDDVAGPTLVVSGTRDLPAMVEITRRLIDGIDGAELYELDAAHLAPFEVPDELVRLLLNFLG